MKSHDILDIYITASPESIEKAYNDKVTNLHDLDISDSAKEKKLKELERAKTECLDYYNCTFPKKCKMEVDDLGKSAMRSEHLNGCCCCMSQEECCDCDNGMCCTNICTNLIETAIAVACIGVIGRIVCVLLEAKSRDKKIEDDRNKERIEQERLQRANRQIEESATIVSKCSAKAGELEFKAKHEEALYRDQLQKFNEFRVKVYEFCNSVGLDITKSQIDDSPAMRSLNNKTNELKASAERAREAYNENNKKISEAKALAEEARNVIRR